MQYRLTAIFLVSLIFLTTTAEAQYIQDFQNIATGENKFIQHNRHFTLQGLNVTTTGANGRAEKYADNTASRGEGRIFRIATADGGLLFPQSFLMRVTGSIGSQAQAIVRIRGLVNNEARWETQQEASSVFTRVTLSDHSTIPVDAVEVELMTSFTDYIALDDFTWMEPKVLPITLLSFHATLQHNGDVLLKWRTTAESSNTSFIVSKSIDDGEFNAIDTIEVNGIPTGEYTYTMIDHAIEEGKHYYKLTEHYADGREKQLDIRMVRKNEKATPTAIFPNPVRGDAMTVNAWVTPTKGISYTISSLSGIAVVKGTLTMPQQTIPIGTLKKGLYWLQLSNGEILQWIKE